MKRLLIALFLGLCFIVPVSAYVDVINNTPFLYGGNPAYASCGFQSDQNPNSVSLSMDNNDTAWNAPYYDTHAVIARGNFSLAACTDQFTHVYATCSGNSTGILYNWNTKYKNWNLTLNKTDDGYYSVKPQCNDIPTRTGTEKFFNIIEVPGSGPNAYNATIIMSWGNLGSPSWLLDADFNGTPTSGQAPLYVAFQDNSTGGFGSRTYNWSVSPANGLIGNTSTSEYPTIVFTQNGNYTITHCVSDSLGSDCETKTDYVWVYNSSAMVTTTFWAVDPLGHRVYDSAISLQDVENTSWTNTSSPSGGVATITSLIGHTINGYATASGYSDGQTTGITADGVSGGIILLAPTNITNVSAGYVTLYVYVKEAVGNAPVSGAYVNIAYASGGSTVNDGGTTSTDGIASFTVPNKTLIYVYGEKAGYQKVSTTKDSGNGSGGSASVSTILYLSRITVTTVPTATTLPGGGTPTTTVTTDPRTSAEKQEDMANILLDYGDELVMFFIVLTIIGGVQLIGKR